jgi:thiamine biosynthesis lipoprotein
MMRAASFRAMGTTVNVTLDDNESTSEVRRLFSHVEQTCSRFIEDSELSRLNRTASSPIELSPLMADILTVAQDVRGITDGLVDVAIGDLVAAWGYDRTFLEVVDLTDPPDDLDLDRNWHVNGSNLWKAASVKLDLGGIAKGWTADVAVELGLATICNAGGDLRSHHPDTVVDIEDPWGNIVTAIHVGRGALATSSVSKRRWKVADREAHHLIDPRTGAPSTSPILSATVVSDRAVMAEAGAKAVLLLGEQGLSWADRQDWIHGALAVWHDGSVYATTGLMVA